MLLLRKVFTSCFILYALAGVILYKGINHRLVHYQFLDNYQWSGPALVKCALDVCPPKTLKSAIHYYYHLSHITKGNADEYNALGFSFYHLKEFNRSLPYFELAVALNSKNFGLYFNQALNLLQMKEYEAALTVLKKGQDNLSPLNFFTPNLVKPHQQGSVESIEEQLRGQYMEAVIKYNELLALTDKIVHAPDLRQKKDLIDYLNVKLNNTKLYYYVPIYNINFQGQSLKLI